MFQIIFLGISVSKFILLQAYGARRYGKKNPLVSKALRLLSNSVYNANATVRNFHGHVLILRHPQLGMKVSILG